jgi:EmrB/QacA subfamily drug resistance transporter
MNTVRQHSSTDKNFILIITTLAAFLTSFGATSMNVALPTIGREFAMDAVLLSWVVTAYVFASALLLVPFGKVGDIYGRKKVFKGGMIVFTLASAGTALSSSSLMLICCRILQGIGSGANYCVGISIVTSVFTTRELGKVLGINSTAVYLGQCLGPSLGGFLTQHLGWRSIFVINVPLSLIMLVLIFRRMKGEWYEARGEKFDLLGSIIFVLPLFLIMYGFSQLSQTRGVWITLLGALGLVAFVKRESRTKTPLLDISLFRKNRGFMFSNLATMIHYSSTYALTYLPVLYLQYIKRLTPGAAGLVMVSQPIVQALLSPVAGRVSDRMESPIVSSIGMTLTAAGLFLFTFLDQNTSVTFVVLSLVFLGFGYAFFAAPNAKAVMSSVENRYYGVASGTIGTMRMVGMSFSMGITIVIFSVYLGKVQITPTYYPLFLKCVKTTFTLFAVLCLVGAAMQSLAREKNVR